MNLHQIQKHPEYVEGCFGCKIGELNISTGAASSRGIPTAKQHDKELGSYYSAIRQGIEPRSTRQPDIDKAMKLSNEAGKAFDGINLKFRD